MKPHELAAQLPEDYWPEPKTHPMFEELNAALNASEAVWEELQAGIFEKNEFGFVKFNVWGTTRPDNPDYVSGIQVFFIDPAGSQIVLGGIYRDDEPQFGYAMVSEDSNKVYSSYLSPEDERWDVIVGTIKEAIEICISNKAELKQLGDDYQVVYQGPELNISLGFYLQKEK